ncbi:MAG: ABC transporter permease [Proteobacteria bacterium]|nr:ABC transporter permease [Burkholderiales bacterium]
MVRGGFLTLLHKETLRFWKVSMQTILAPVVTTLLYLMIFAHVLANHIDVFPGVAYDVFLVPGLVMMAVLQNAFANTSSSMIQSKMTGNLVFILLPPLSPGEIVCAYVLAAVLRGFLCGVAVLAVGAWFVPLPIAHPFAIIAFALASAAVMGALGLIAGVYSDKVDQLSAFQHFVVVPLTFLAGVFYSVQTLPSFWQVASHLNPVFYMVDGFRWGFLGAADVSPWMSFGVVLGCLAAVMAWAVLLVKSGYKLRH